MVKKPIIINLFGAPGAGKSTTAAGIFFELKTAGINCELIREYAKDKVWEKNETVFGHQDYIFGKQRYRQDVPASQVDVVVTDSPILLSALYNRDGVLGKDFNDLVMKVFNEQDNMNYFINRVKPYNPAGRHQDEAGAKAVDVELKTLLDLYNVSCEEVNGDRGGLYTIVNDIFVKLGQPDIYYYTSDSNYGHSFMVTDYEMPTADWEEE